MKSKFTKIVLVLSICMLIGSLPVASNAQGIVEGIAQEIVPDANTVILDHFDGTTGGTAVGGLSFATSLNGLGQAGVFGVGNYVQYAFAGWPGGQGTVEMWIYPDTLGGSPGLLNVNWNNVGSYPPAGHILHLIIATALGDAVQGGFWPSGGATGNTAIPAGQWTHIALSWGPASTKVYVNGAPVVGTPGGPSLISTNYAYLNYWGTLVEGLTPSPFDGLIDEFHLSNVQRSDAEIAQHATLTPTNQPPSVATAGDVTVDEGDTAANTGTVSDPDGDIVTLTASVGTITNNNDGTWSWSFATSDGPADSQTVTITADDGNGGTAQTTFQLTVNNVAPSVHSISVALDPVNINDQPISASATFSDPAGTNDEPYTCTLDYDDGAGAKAGTVSSTTCIGPDQTYAESGVYQVTVTVTDKNDGSGTATATEFIVVYDPSAGFVTGGGWIMSPEGACQFGACTDDTTGKATFGFVSKYKKGATTPIGNTEFVFHAADLNFHSSSYEWLIVTGSNYAMFKGEGTINGAMDTNGNAFKFMLWAGDDSPDTFRIRIWWEDTDSTEYNVYDNGTDQAIGGGSIVVHTSKK